MHRFAHPGRYLVEVNLTQDGRSLETHDVQPIRVTAAPAHHHAATGGGSGGAGSGGAGDGGAGGGTGSAGGGTGGGGASAGTGAASGEAGGAAPPPRTPARRPRARRHAPRQQIPRAPRPPQGTLVSGTLLASASATPLPAGATERAGQGGTPSDGPLRIPAIAWVAAGLVAILALGWALEARHTPPFWQP